MYIRVRVDLRRVIGSRAARRGLVLLRVPAGARAASLPVSWLLRRLRALLTPAPPALHKPLALCVRGHLLPPREALAVLRAGDTVQIFPLKEDDELTYNTDEVLPMYDEEVMLKKQRKNCDLFHQDFVKCLSTESIVQHNRDQPDGLLEEEKHRALRLLENLASPYVASSSCSTNISFVQLTPYDQHHSNDSHNVCEPPSKCSPPESYELAPTTRRRRVRRRRTRNHATAPVHEPAPVPAPVALPAPKSLSVFVQPTPLHIRMSDSDEAPMEAAGARRGRAVRALDTHQNLSQLTV